MTDSRADGPPGRAISALPPAPSGAGIPKINQFTGLSTDYLNHFTEVVMVLEMGAMVEGSPDNAVVQQLTTSKAGCERQQEERRT